MEAVMAPLTLEGSSVLHQMMRVRWTAWKALPQADRQQALAEALPVLHELAGEKQSALYSLVGHKGDLMFVHFRRGFEPLNEIEWKLARLRLFDYLEPTTSYVSVIELGLYDTSYKIYGQLAERGIEPHTPEWDREVEEAVYRQRDAMAPRLWQPIPDTKYLCFYPMDKRRGESKNWYRLPMAERVRMNREHGTVGRRYAGEVKQIISGSIGYDDWEWGVDLFADDPLVFKKLISEMRFDEVSAEYALFGSFYLGIRRNPEEIAGLL